MKIGILCYPTYGGSGIVATELGMDLAEKGHEVHFMSYSLPTRLDITLPNIKFHQVNVKTYPLFEYQPYTLALSTTIVDIAETYGLDLLHVHYAIPHAYAAYFAQQILKEKGIDLPFITTLHGTDITLVGHHPVYQSAVEFSINHSTAVTSVSESLKQDTLRHFNIKKEIQVIPNFIDNALFDAERKCHRKNFAHEHQRILIHVSNLRKVKRVTDVIKTFYLVQKEIDAILILVGEGPEWEKVEMLIKEYGIMDRVRVLGKVNNLYDILCVSDLFLLPSEQESFGLAALEAMAARTAVVSSDAGGIPEVNIDGKTGFVCPIGDVEQMAARSIEILKEVEVLNAFKARAKKQAQAYDKVNVLPIYEDLYVKVLNVKELERLS